MIYYEYEEFLEDVYSIGKEVNDKFKPDVILAVARGGLTFGQFLSEALEIRNLYTLNSVHYDGQEKLNTIDVFNIPDLSQKKKILLVDEIIDSGETLLEIKNILLKKFPHIEIKTATLFYKSKAILSPDFTAKHADDWIHFFWGIKLSDRN